MKKLYWLAYEYPRDNTKDYYYLGIFDSSIPIESYILEYAKEEVCEKPEKMGYYSDPEFSVVTEEDLPISFIMKMAENCKASIKYDQEKLSLLEVNISKRESWD